MENVAFHSFFRWKMIILPILTTTSLTHFPFKRLLSFLPLPQFQGGYHSVLSNNLVNVWSQRYREENSEQTIRIQSQRLSVTWTTHSVAEPCDRWIVFTTLDSPSTRQRTFCPTWLSCGQGTLQLLLNSRGWCSRKLGGPGAWSTGEILKFESLKWLEMHQTFMGFLWASSTRMDTFVKKTKVLWGRTPYRPSWDFARSPGLGLGFG